ncbi:retrovirus-related Pol polyprotein from transposon 297 [Trichonephila clavipes]|nr:retrovirus-related Pol polyprotein from transposon 297 [Trichonephila clavipes]
MEDDIQRSAGKRYNSKMDVKSAFNCISIRETGIYKTGFVTSDRHYELLRMPFGVTNGPSTMARAIKLIDNHLEPHNGNTYIVSEITLFGRIVSPDGVPPDLERIAAIECYLTLKSIQEVRSFLGFANQFRKYIRNYAVIAKPLTSVLKGLEKKAKTDASYSGLGAVLSQEQNGKRRVIEYASRTLKDVETRYHSNEHELECTSIH